MNRIITISREYGAGGHSIGRRVAEELGIPFYDRDIVKQTVKVPAKAELLWGGQGGAVPGAGAEAAERERFGGEEISRGLGFRERK